MAGRHRRAAGHHATTRDHRALRGRLVGGLDVAVIWADCCIIAPKVGTDPSMDLNQRPHHANSKAVGMKVPARIHAVVFTPPISSLVMVLIASSWNGSSDENPAESSVCEDRAPE